MRAVFVFCEGNHDIVFATRSLGAMSQARWIKKPIRELPSPFGPVPDPTNTKPKVESIIVRRYSARALDSLQIRAAAQAPPPTFEALVEIPNGPLFALIRSHGDGGAAPAIDLMNDIISLLPMGVDVTEVAAAFLFDADTGLADRETTFSTTYSPLFGAAGAPAHGTWVKGPDFPIGLFVFHEAATLAGTLEAHLGPLVQAEWPARWQDAGTYLATHAAQGDPVTLKASEQLKAQICITGQFGFPGDPMTQVLGREGLPGRHFQGPASQDLVNFLLAVPW